MQRKRGETYRQLLARATAAIDSMQETVQATKAMLCVDQIYNPRTGNTYKDEAQFMFTTLAIIEAELRGTDSNVLAAARETLEQLGFNIVDQYENKCLKDGAYVGK